MPFAVPIENVIAAEHAVHTPDSARSMVANYERTDIEFTGTLPDYEHLTRPLVEVFTLDSTTCAACTYMLAAAKDAVAAMDSPVDVVEYRYTVPENIARCKKMQVKQLPSIYIQGKLVFSSIIPSRTELMEAIRKAAK